MWNVNCVKITKPNGLTNGFFYFSSEFAELFVEKRGVRFNYVGYFIFRLCLGALWLNLSHICKFVLPNCSATYGICATNNESNVTTVPCFNYASIQLAWTECKANTRRWWWGTYTTAHSHTHTHTPEHITVTI